MKWLSVGLLGNGASTLPLQRLEGLLLPLAPCVVFFMSLLYAGRYFLELPQIAADGGCGSIQRFAILGLVAVWVALQLLEDEVCVAI
jgi:hypothetical protein